ncbi:topoisomerase IV [Methanobrevibacter sp.]|uniref:topoisomerase IV n=1 Tax=Methanobrevibacter sp. TaxID=66852 RepID=UPI00386E2100
MKDSKEKEHRISNLKDMIDTVKDDEESFEFDDIEEDSELIDYLNEHHVDDEEDELEIDDEFIYRPDDEDDAAVNLEENPVDEEYIIKTPKAKDSENDDEYDEYNDELMGDISENFDNVVNAKIRGRPILAIIGSVLGVILIVLSIFIFQSRSDRVVDNVVAGETSFMFVIFLIVGLLLLIYGIYKLFNIKNPFENLTKDIDSIDDEKKDENKAPEETPSPKPIPKSNIPLDKDSYKIGEFDIKDLKTSLKKPTDSKKDKTVEEDVEEIPRAKEKRPKQKELTAEEIEEIEYEHAQLENESIDDIFAEVEDIEDMPIISIDSKEKNE